MTRYYKGILYASLTALLLAFSALLQNDLHAPDIARMGTAYTGSMAFLFILAAIMMGGGLFGLFRVRKTGRHLSDCLFGMLIGTAAMILWLFLTMGYGGLEPPFEQADYMAANTIIVALSMIPLSFLIRSLYISFTLDEDKRSKTWLLYLLNGVLTVTFLLLTLTGTIVVPLVYMN